MAAQAGATGMNKQPPGLFLNGQQTKGGNVLCIDGGAVALRLNEPALAGYPDLTVQAAVAAYGSDTTPGPFDAEKFAGFKGTYMGREMTVSEMKAHQLAWAVKRVERVLLQAWKEAKPS